MNASSANVIDIVKKAFANRRKPNSSGIIYEKYKSDHDFEAQAVLEFIDNMDGHTIGNNRNNVVFDALIYVSPEAACFYVPLVMISLIEEFSDSEALYDSLYYALNKKALIPNPAFELSDYLSSNEKVAVCNFAQWVISANSDTEIIKEYHEIERIYCI